MSDWHINPVHTGGIEGWVSLHKTGIPNCPFAFVHEDEAEQILSLRAACTAMLKAIDDDRMRHGNTLTEPMLCAERAMVQAVELK